MKVQLSYKFQFVTREELPAEVAHAIEAFKMSMEEVVANYRSSYHKEAMELISVESPMVINGLPGDSNE